MITGVKWNDFDGDGVRDPGEPGLSNWTIRLSDVSGEVLEETSTDADGRYEFTELSPGTYAVAEEPQIGYEPPSLPADLIKPWRFTPVRSYRAPSSPI